MSDRNAKIIEEFRANAGKVGGFFSDQNVLILHTTGAKTGRQRVTPVVYRQEGNRIFIFATKGGSPSHPDWYHNLRANPAVVVEIGTETSRATAVEIAGEERDAIYARQSAAFENFARYAASTNRVIPVVELLID